MVDTVYVRQVMETQLRGVFEVDDDGRRYRVWIYDSHDNIYTTSGFGEEILVARMGMGDGEGGVHSVGMHRRVVRGGWGGLSMRQ